MIRHILTIHDLKGFYSKSFVDDTAAVKAFCDETREWGYYDSNLSGYLYQGWLHGNAGQMVTLTKVEIY
jgi:hypothetical protein